MPVIALLAGLTHLGSLWSGGAFLLLLLSVAGLALPAYLEGQVARGNRTAA